MRALAALLVLLCACGKKEQARPAAPTSKTSWTCTIQIKKKTVAADVSGTATAAAEQAALEAAWADACSKLPDVDKPNCHSADAYAATTSTGSATSKGKTSFTVTVTLKPIAPTSSGKSKSDVSEDAACAAATLEACKSAGDPTDCVASGAFEPAGRGTSKSIELQP